MGDVNAEHWAVYWREVHGICLVLPINAGEERAQDGRLYGAIYLRTAIEPEAVAAVPIVHHDNVTMSE